jgi:heme/copper-type cytochrome/quinol oxidase subunit 3
MLRSVFAVIVGYVAMFAVAFAAYTAAYFGLGADRAFEPGTYALSGIWIGLVIAITLISGLIGGLTCAAISKSRTAGLVFAVIVLVLGFVFELPNIMKKDHAPEARTGDVSNMDAMGKAQPPAWLCLLNPFLAAAAVLMGTRMKKSPEV